MGMLENHHLLIDNKHYQYWIIMELFLVLYVVAHLLVKAVMLVGCALFFAMVGLRLLS